MKMQILRYGNRDRIKTNERKRHYLRNIIFTLTYPDENMYANINPETAAFYIF